MPKIHFFTQADNQPPETQKEPPVPKAKYRLTNWQQYNKALIDRGSITLWLDEATLSEWYYQGPRSAGGVFVYSEQCIQAALSLKAFLRLAFRQTQGLVQSILDVLKMELQAPCYTQLCRRQARLTAFVPQTPPSESDCEPIHVILDSTGLKVYGEGDGGARALEGKEAQSRQAPHLAQITPCSR